MRFHSIRSILPALLLFAADVRAAETSLSVNPEGDGAPYAAVYSEGVMLRARLTSGGDPVSGQRVSFRVTPAGSDASFLLDDPVTDAAGVATTRLTLVNGRYGGQTFPAEAVTPDNEGARYVIAVSFEGEVDADDPRCQAGDAGIAVDGGDDPLCPSNAEGELFVGLETAEIALQPGNRVALGDELTLYATLIDADGIAPLAGTDKDGSEPAPVEGANVSFYFDLDRDERPAAGERIGADETDSNGVATITFTADPAFYFAGDFPAGLHVQFGGDDRYAFAGAAGRIVVDPGAADASRTVIEAEPAEALADGISRIKLTAILVDSANNPLSVDSPESTVRFTTDLGLVLEESALRDPITGYYSQELRAPDDPGTATVTVEIDGVAGASREIVFSPTGNCACQGVPPSSAVPFFVVGLALFLPLFRSRRKEPLRA